MDIEYDLLKEKINQTKHGVSFDEAATALHDPMALVVEDIRSLHEHRYVLLGLSSKARLIVVVYAMRIANGNKPNQPDEIVRIISARKASKKEAKSYA